MNEVKFYWNGNITHIESCNHYHFMYISSKIVNELELNAELILKYFIKIEMNGLLFKLIKKHIFIKNVSDLLEQDKQNIDSLYSKIKTFDFRSIRPSSICTINLCYLQFDENNQSMSNNVCNVGLYIY